MQNIAKQKRLGSKGPPIGNGKWSRDRRRHVTLKDQTPDPNTLRALYLKTAGDNCNNRYMLDSPL